MENEDVKKALTTKSKRARIEQRGRFISFVCIALIVFVVGAIFYFVASKGLSTFFVDKINVFDFLFGTVWNPSATGPDGKPLVGALPMILGSFMVTFLSAIVATPFAIGAAVFMTEISPTKGQKFLQPVIELLVGIPWDLIGNLRLVRHDFTNGDYDDGRYIKISATSLPRSFTGFGRNALANDLQSCIAGSDPGNSDRCRIRNGSGLW